MKQETQNKFAEILKAQLEAANAKQLKKTAPAPEPTPAKKPDPIPAPERPELSTVTFADLFGTHTVKPAKTPPAQQTPALLIIDYSEKAFAVVGDTKPVKDKLHTLGGRFNYYLNCGPGWIFSKKRLSEVKQQLNID